MSYKNGRSENLFSKTNRVDRYKQMSKQQQLIEEKKRQIQEKQEQLKKKEVEDALKKSIANEANNDKKPLVFSNDGTFLDQFRKLSGIQGQDNGNKDDDTDKCSSTDFIKEEDSVTNIGYVAKEIPTNKEEGYKSDDSQEDPIQLSQQRARLPHHDPHSISPHQSKPPISYQQPMTPQPQQMPGLPPHPPPPQFQQSYHIPYSVPPPPPLMPPSMMPQTLPPPIIPQSIPPPRPINVQNIPPPPLNIPPPPLPPRYPPPPQFPVQLPPSIRNLCVPPPIFNSHQVPAEKIQGNTQSEGYTPPLEIKQEPDSKDWFTQMKGNSPDTNSIEKTIDAPAIVKEELMTDIKQEQPNNDQKLQKTGERKRKSRWSDEKDLNVSAPVTLPSAPKFHITGMSGHMLSKVTRKDPGLMQYAMTAYGSSHLTDEDWKKAEENYKVHLLYQDMMAKRAELEKLKEAGKNKYEYDSDEEIDEKGTWEHKLREKEMVATQEWAESLTEMAKGKHHIGDFLPPDELKKFLAKYQAAKGGEGEPDLSDYKEYKLGEENKGFQMLQKLGWTEGQGLGSDGAGRLDPINKGKVRDLNEGLGLMRPDDISTGDDEYDAYRKRMMLAYRFRPNPLNNPRRPYY